MKNNSLLLLLFLCLFLSTNISAVPGDFDTSFNMTGKRRTGFGFGYDGANGLVRLPDGKFLAAGYAQVGRNNEFAIARFTADGALDTTFGDGGKVTTNIGIGGDSAESIAVQTDGKIVVAGSAGSSNGPIANTGNLGDIFDISDIAIVRYNADGTLDTSFGAGGKIVIDSGFGTDYATDVAIQPDGNIIVVGGVAATDGASNFYIARFLTNGSPDNTFGTNGSTRFGFGFSSNFANAVALQSDGKIVAAGNSGNFFTAVAVARLNTDGSLDTTFSGDGKVLYEFGKSSGIANDVAIQTDGKIVVAGHQGFFASQNFVTFRFMTDGALDTTFDSDGRVDTNFGTASYGQAVAIQTDGKIVVAGLTGGSGIDDFALARYNSDGSPDTSFDTDGILLTDFGANIDGANALVIQSDGNIVAAGYGAAPGRTDGDFALARYTTTGALDTNFDADGLTTADIGSGQSSAEAVVVQTDGKVIAAGYAQNANETRDFALVRYTLSGGLDQTFGSGGKLLTDFGSDDAAYALAVQPDGKIVAAGISNIKGDEVFAIARYTAEGALDKTFGEGGKVRLLIGDFNGASSVAVQPDGKIVVAGYTSIKGQYDFLVARLTATGELDTSFDGDGYAITDYNGFDDRINGISLQTDGKIVAAGSSYSGANNDFAVARYNTDGSPDTTFDVDGKTTTDFNGTDDDGNAVAIQYDGKIVVAGEVGIPPPPPPIAKKAKAGKTQLGSSVSDFGLVRYTSTGALDETFDTDGKATTDFAGGRDGANSVVIQPGGRILVAGYASTVFTEVSPSGINTGSDFALARYEMQAGALDTTFGTGGKQTQDITGTEDIAYAVKLDPFGNIVVAGASDTLFTVARLLNNVAPNAANVSVSGRVMTNRGSSISRAVVTMTDSRGNIKRYVTGAFGFYRFTDVVVGETYIVNISSKRYRFDAQVLNVTEDVEDLNFTPSY